MSASLPVLHPAAGDSAEARLLQSLRCPACRGGLDFDGEARDGRVTDGSLTCAECGRQFPVRDEVVVLALDDASREGVVQGGTWLERGVYERTAANADRLYSTDAVWREMVETALLCGGPLIDIATGPGGSLSVPYLRRAADDALFVLTDLSEPVVQGQHAFLREAGLAANACFLVCDACRLPLADGAAAAVTSVVGLGNVLTNRPAYQEAGRVLKKGGWLIDAERVFEPGSSSAKRARQWGSCIATRNEWLSTLEGSGFIVGKVVEWVSGRGKSEPEDGLPLDDEAWISLVAYACKR